MVTPQHVGCGQVSRSVRRRRTGQAGRCGRFFRRQALQPTRPGSEPSTAAAVAAAGRSTAQGRARISGVTTSPSDNIGFQDNTKLDVKGMVTQHGKSAFEETPLLPNTKFSESSAPLSVMRQRQCSSGWQRPAPAPVGVQQPVTGLKAAPSCSPTTLPVTDPRGQGRLCASVTSSAGPVTSLRGR